MTIVAASDPNGPDLKGPIRVDVCPITLVRGLACVVAPINLCRLELERVINVMGENKPATHCDECSKKMFTM